MTLKSPFYATRHLIEEQIYHEITQPGALVRIEAPREMGKTSLLLRILDQAKPLNYRTVSLNLEQVDRAKFSNLNQFLRWMCVNISHQLQLQPKMDQYWDEEMGNQMSCTLYFQDYLLERVQTPLILALDEINQIFEYPDVANHVFRLFRAWHEAAKTQTIWQKLRLIILCSTEIYVHLPLNPSPFSIGLPIYLNSFSRAEVLQLSKRYELDGFGEQDVEKLTNLVGGHPALVQITFYHLSRQVITLAQILENPTIPTGIYGSHLHRHSITLEEQPDLGHAFYEIVNAAEPVELDPLLALIG